jgi:hypothetical protein
MAHDERAQSDRRGMVARLLLLPLALVLAASPRPDEVATPAFSGGRTLLFPPGDVFTVAIADPHRPVNAAAGHLHTGVAIEGAEGARVWLAAGGRFGILRRVPEQTGGRSWQLSVEAGFDALYDSENKADNVGYDGNYGLVLTTRAGGAYSFKLAVLHTSGHVGDEWADRTGRRRLRYTREEIAFASARTLGAGTRVYGEIGRAHYRLNRDLQEPWRVQGGLERESPRALAQGRLGWYLAADLQAWEERAWRLDVAVEIGLAAYSAGRRWRLGVRWVDGRVPLGEFFRDRERWFSLGLWMDL